MKEMHQRKASQMTKNANGSAGLLHKITKPTTWSGGVQIQKKRKKMPSRWTAQRFGSALCFLQCSACNQVSSAPRSRRGKTTFQAFSPASALLWDVFILLLLSSSSLLLSTFFIERFLNTSLNSVSVMIF